MPAELPVVSVWYLTSSSPLLHKGQGEINELANRLMDVRRVFCYHRTRLVSHPLRVSTLQAFASHHLIHCHVRGLFASSGFPAPSYMWKTAVLSSQVSGQRGAEIE